MGNADLESYIFLVHIKPITQSRICCVSRPGLGDKLCEFNCLVDRKNARYSKIIYYYCAVSENHFVSTVTVPHFGNEIKLTMT